MSSSPSSALFDEHGSQPARAIARALREQVD
jgi:hypothetical protein